MANSTIIFSMRTHLLVILCVGLIATVSASSMLFVAADYSICVKSGDYVVWKTTIIGRPIRNVTGARMDILDVEDEFIFVRISTYYANGTTTIRENTFNQLRGSMGDDLIVPRNLNVGDQFYDQYVGNITISSLGRQSYCGAMRNVMFGSMRNTSFTWDRETGLLVNATSSYTRRDGTLTVINTQLSETNVWQPDMLGMPPAMLQTVIIGVVAGAVIAVVVVAAWRLKGSKLKIFQRKSRYSSQVGKGAYWLREFEKARRHGLGYVEPQNKKTQRTHNNEKT